MSTEGVHIVSDRHTQHEANVILHTAEKGTGPDDAAATARLHHDKITMSPKDYAKLLAEIETGSKLAHKKNPDLPMVFVVPGKGGHQDEVHGCVLPTKEHKP
jgi:hypothetical protein